MSRPVGPSLAELREKLKRLPRQFFPGASLVASVLLTVAKRGSLTPKDARRHWGREGDFVARELTISRLALLVGREPHGRAMQDLLPRDELVLTRRGREIVQALEEVAELAGFIQDSEFYPGAPKRTRGEA